MPQNPKKTRLLISAGILAVFVLFSAFVGREYLSNIDFASTVKVQNHLSKNLDAGFSLLSLIGSFEVTSVALVVFLFFFFHEKPKAILITLAVFAIGSSIEVLGKMLLFHPSPPFFFYRGVGVLFPSSYIHTNYSYPSGHLFRATFLTILLIFLVRTKEKTITVICALFILIMAISRVSLGEHWLTDVVGGMLLGVSLGLFSTLFIPRPAKRK